MKPIRVPFLSALLLAGCVMLADVAASQAVTCASTCNQLRRACRSVAMATVKVDYANCDDAREACWAACEANAEQCPLDCDTAYQACVSGGGLTCDADLAQCLDDCANCRIICNDERVSCRDDAKLARAEANVLCDAVRESCGTDCVDPIDPACVRSCKTDRRDCDGDAKRAEKTCRAGCPKGTGQKACVRACRRDKNSNLGLCADQEVLCYGACAGLIP